MNKKGKVTGKAASKRLKVKQKTTVKTGARQHYKDTVFRMIFNDRENLLSLYNAVNKTAYTEVDNLEITTLENAIDSQPMKRVLRLSDAFIKKQEQPELELLVTVYNINWGYNKELMKACRLLEEYAQYVDQVRQFANQMPFEEAVEKAVVYAPEYDEAKIKEDWLKL